MEQELTVGEVLNGTISTVKQNARAAILFVALFTGLGVAADWGLMQYAAGAVSGLEATETFLAILGIGAGLGGILFFILTVIGQYFLWEAMLRRQNSLHGPRRRRLLAFFGQAILLSLGIAVGMLLLIIPGLIFSARWSMAQAFLIVENQGVIESMRSSWDAVLGNTTPIVLVVVIVAIVVFALGMVGGANPLIFGYDAAQSQLFTSFVIQFASQLSALLNAALGVFLFARLHPTSDGLSEVFE